MKKLELKIKGMSCHHCIASVKGALEKVDTVIVEEVTIGNARVRYDESKVTPQQLEQAVEQAGYEPVPS